VFLAAGIFNLPSIMKKPVTNSDWMMLVIVIFFIVLGLFAILLPKFIHKK
jgi:nitric oxide reductase large subunit